MSKYDVVLRLAATESQILEPSFSFDFKICFKSNCFIKQSLTFISMFFYCKSKTIFSLHMHAKPPFAHRLQTAKMALGQNGKIMALGGKKWPLGVK